ncbi:MAG: glycosyltransferase [Parachlamydiaceae bacterium]|nr:glycosyltransferase [Parachlamydiaceae bacterium]
MLNKVKNRLNIIRDICAHFYKGWKSSLLFPYSKAFLKLAKETTVTFHKTLLGRFNKLNISDDKYKRLQQTSTGLLSLMPKDDRFCYSILIVVNDPIPSYFATALQSAISQRLDSLEILIGYHEKLDSEISKIIVEFQNKFPAVIQTIKLENQIDSLSAINEIATHAKGNFIFFLDEKDWIRPDFLLRYEQTLRFCKKPKLTVLYCNENKISENGFFIPCSELYKPETLNFPYFFNYFSEKGLMIPNKLWKLIGGLRPVCEGAEYEDLLLRLDASGASFKHIPIALYSERINLQKSSKQGRNAEVFIESLKEYVKTKKLAWDFTKGFETNFIRAIPKISQKHRIQVIIPFKDQKELTLRSVHSILRQTDVSCVITAVDNRSQDRSISEELQNLGCEVLFIDEPFNYSRLNNLAVKNTKTANNCDVILFLNNDVELDSDALIEMLRWIEQPDIGMVGCRLHYPDNRLQHGGIKLSNQSIQVIPEMQWEHIDRFYPIEKANAAKNIAITEAVTAACALMKKDVFLGCEGFDEIWYPIGYSDTNLAFKLKQKGLKCLYTPYAKGIHHESISRKDGVEDYESLWWLHKELINFLAKDTVENSPKYLDNKSFKKELENILQDDAELMQKLSD